MRFSFAVLLMTLLSGAAAANDLRVVVDGIRDGRGTVMVALYADSAEYEADDRFAGAFVRAAPGQVVVVFPGLKPGDYAVSAFHDENGNGELDADFFGVPQEGYGFSNGAKGLLGPPTFSAASFTTDGATPAITLTLNY